MPSQAGAAWTPFYESGQLSWVEPEKVNRNYVEKLARSEWIRRLLALAGLEKLGGALVLEAGCGTGLYAFALAWWDCRTVAFDYNLAAVEMAQGMRRAADVESSRVQLLAGNLLAIPFFDGSFDLVFNQGVMEYFCNDAEFDLALREMARVLKPGGALVLIVQNSKHPLRGLKRRLGWRGFENQPPVRALAAAELGAALRGLGLTDVRADGIDPWKGLFFGVPLFTRTRRAHTLTYLLYRGLARLVPLPRAVRSRLAVQFIVAAHKPAGV